MMLVLDKVVNYEAYATLYVITSGVVVAYLCNGVLGYLKLYLLDFLSQKVEAKLSIKAFEKPSFSMQRFNKESIMFSRFTSQITQIKNTSHTKNFFNCFGLYSFVSICTNFIFLQSSVIWCCIHF